MYTLFLLWALAALAVGARLLERPERRRRGLPLALGLLLGLAYWTHQFGLFLWGGIALAAAGSLALARIRADALARQPLVRSFAFALVVAMLVSLPGLWRTSDFVARRLAAGPNPLASVVLDVAAAIRDLVGLGAWGLGVYALAAFGLWRLSRVRPRPALLLAALAGVAIASAFAFQSIHHVFRPRHLTLLEPPLWIGLACLPVLATSSRRRAVAAAPVLALAVVFAWHGLGVERWEQAPGRLVIGHLIIDTAARRAPDEAVRFEPEFLELVGRYYGLAADPALQGEGPALPEGFEAPATWILAGWAETEDARAALEDRVAVLAGHYGVAFDRGALDSTLRRDPFVRVRVDAAGIEVDSALDFAASRRRRASP
jgi:hypothetical protein